MSRHLGPVASAFLDGALEHGRRDEVLAHLAHCAPCREELAVQRGLRVCLLELPGPRPSGSLAERLLAVAVQAAPAAPPSRRRVLRARRARRPSAHPVARRAAVGGALLVLGLGASLGVAGPPPRGQVAPVDPASAQFVLDHSGTSTEVPFEELAVVSAALGPAPR